MPTFRVQRARAPGDPPGETVTESFDEAVFRRALAQFASGVVVVTGHDADGPLGLTCQSFSSLSLDPPLVLLSTARSSVTWPRIRATGRFGVNVLSAGQRPVSDAFAVSGGDKFAGVDWRDGRLGMPLIAGSLAHLECDLHAEHDGGDHTIVVGRVRALEADGLGEAPPLVYFRSRYRDLA